MMAAGNFQRQMRGFALNPRSIVLLLSMLLTQLGSAGVVHSEDVIPSEEEINKEAATQQRIGVIYPQVREPYRSIFLSMIRGIEEGLDEQVPIYELPASEDSETAVNTWLDDNRFDATIVLGKRGLRLLPTLDQGQRLVFGAVYTNPDEVDAKARTISMAPAPAMLFDRLLELTPTIRRISVIHDETEHDWLLELGRVAAKERGLELQVINCADIRAAADAYRSTLKQGVSGSDAVWLLQGSRFLQERSLLQMILEEAWRRNLVVFSSNPSHVPKGALFALYPDNNELGHELALAARGQGPAAGVTPVYKLDTAVNLRTAEHLGIDIERQQEEDFDMVFPTR